MRPKNKKKKARDGERHLLLPPALTCGVLVMKAETLTQKNPQKTTGSEMKSIALPRREEGF